MASFSSVSDLKPFKSMWKIKVKIIRLWKQYSVAGGETIEMVLIDSKGDKIHATVKKDLISRFEPFLSPDCTKILINFSLSHSCGSYRTTNHPYKIKFLSTTRVRTVEEQLPNELNGFEPVSFNAILGGTLNPDYLIDVIGQIAEVTHLEIVSVNGKDTQKLTMELRNSEDVRLPIVLWGPFACEVNHAVQIRDDPSLVIVMRFAKIKVWKEDRSVSNAYNVSEVLVNPKMQAVEIFNSLLPQDALPLAIVDSKPLALVKGVSEKDDFFVHTPRKTISEVLESRQVERAVVLGTIAAIDADMGWYYLSCKTCAKKVVPVPNDDFDVESPNDVVSHNYYCGKCKIDNPKLLPRYKLHLIVLDNTSTTKFLLFDPLAVQLLHTPCLALTGPVNDEIQEADELPLALTNLVGKTFLFKIGIEKENFVYKHDTYTVLKIITDAEIVTEFNEKDSPSKDSPQATMNTLAADNSMVSDAPEGSLMLSESSETSNSSKSASITPSKRREAPVVNLEESFDQNSVTKSASLSRSRRRRMIKVAKERSYGD